MQYNKDEKKCIRIIAKWFRENKRTVNRSEAIKEFGVDDDTYDVLMKIMEHNGVVEVESGTREGYASLIRPLAYAEELAREFDAEENETNQKNKTLEHTSLQNDFIEFLKKKKGYPRESMLLANKGGEPNLSIIEPGSKNPIVLIEFGLSNEQIVLGRLALDFLHYKQTKKLSNCLAYIVCPSLDKSSEPFEICKVSDNGYESILINDFPKYEDLIKKMEKETEVFEDEAGGNKKVVQDVLDLRIAFEKYLVDEKGYTPENYSTEQYGDEYPVTKIQDNEGKVLALMAFCLERSGADKAFEGIKEYKKKEGISGVPNYVIFVKDVQDGAFTILEYEGDGASYESYEISYGDFPTYNELLFVSQLSDRGRRICWALTRLAKDEHGFSVHAPCEDYVNLKIKKNGRTAAQIHRVNDSDENIALVLAGYQRYFPEAKLPTYMFEGEVEKLSGYTSKSQGERNWLEGNLGHPQLKHNAGVYILKPGSLLLDEVENEVGVLLELAKSNAENKGGVEIEEIGSFVKVTDDKLAEKDLLGRKGLVDALADIFSRTDDFKGFTVALLGEWGEGKSTVMKLITDKLKKKQKRRFDFATFNAWEYENTNNIAAGMAQEVVKGLADNKMKYVGNLPLRIGFILYEYWSALFRLILYCGFASIPLFLVYYSEIEVPKEYLGIGIGGGAIAVAIYLFKNIKHIFEHPIAVKLETFLKLPNYRKHLGLVPILKRHIEILCKLKLNAIKIGKYKCGKDRRLVVFIDDLDRCKPDCIAETLDAIRLVMTVPNVIVFICIDHRIAFKAVEKYYQELGDDKLGRSGAEIARDYLAKIIQLPINLIPVSPREIGPFVKTKLFPNVDFNEQGEKLDEGKGKLVATIDDGNVTWLTDETEEKNTKEGDNEHKNKVEDFFEPFAKQIDKETKQEVVIETEIYQVTDEEIIGTTEEYNKFIELIGEYGFTNPRQLLRLRNSYRFLRVINLKLRFEWEKLLTMLFWQEFLHNWGYEVRNKCMAVLWELSEPDDIVEVKARSTVEGVRKQLHKVFVNDKDYADVAKYVRMVVLPHNEEGIFDTKEDINEWLKKEKEAEEKEIQKKTIAGE